MSLLRLLKVPSPYRVISSSSVLVVQFPGVPVPVFPQRIPAPPRDKVLDTPLPSLLVLHSTYVTPLIPIFLPDQENPYRLSFFSRVRLSPKTSSHFFRLYITY